MKLLAMALVGFMMCGCAWGQVTHPKLAPAKVVPCKDGDKKIWITDSWEMLHSPEPSPGVCNSGKWVVDQEALAARNEQKAKDALAYEKRQKHKIDLWNWLRTRVISDKEMSEVLDLGTDIVPEKDGGVRQIYNGETFNGDYQAVIQARTAEAEKILQFALVQQFKMRQIARESK